MVGYEERRYAFYRMLGAPIPLERHFFAYAEGDPIDLDYEERQKEAYKRAFPDIDLDRMYIERDGQTAIRSDVHPATFSQEWLSLDEESYAVLARDVPSRSTVDYSVQMVASVLQGRQWIWSWMPFFEAVYLTGSPTFNITTSKHTVSFVVIADIGRVWYVWWSMRFVLFLMNVFSWVWWYKYTYSCNIVCDRTTAHLGKLKRSHGDISFVYELAHAVELYRCNEWQPSSLYVHNRWLIDYLPDFPLKPVIRIGIQSQYGKMAIRTAIEKIFWWKIGDFLEIVLRCIGMWVLLLHTGRITTKRLVAKRDMARKKLMLQRKMQRTIVAPTEVTSWSRPLFDHR